MEYAIEAIKLGSTAVGIQTKEGVILAVEKRLTSPLLEPSSVEKVSSIACPAPPMLVPASGEGGGDLLRFLSPTFLRHTLKTPSPPPLLRELVRGFKKLINPYTGT